jgi:hypothetical protein
LFKALECGSYNVLFIAVKTGAGTEICVGGNTAIDILDFIFKADY